MDTTNVDRHCGASVPGWESQMTTVPVVSTASIGELLRQWRQRRRVSQLELSITADISTRHLSFVETGRSRPSSEMILRLSEHLDVPLRERNRLLLAGGFAPTYPENDLGAPDLAAAREAVREVLVAHEPYPALAVDRTWNIVDANASVSVLTQLVAPELLEGTVNALRLTLHPDGLAPHIQNLAQWRAAVLGGLRRNAQARADPEMLMLYDELALYPCGQDDYGPELTERGGVYVPLLLRVGDQVLSFLAIIATFGTALDVTLSELAIESFFPADASTAAYLRKIAGDDRS